MKSEAVRTIKDVCRASVNDGMPEHLRESQSSGQTELSKLRLEINVSYRMRAIITGGLYTFYPLFEIHLCTVTFGIMYG